MNPLLTRPFVTACAMHFCGAMAMSFYILFPLYVRELGGSEFTIGLYAGLLGAAGVVARFPVGRLLDTQGRRRVLVGAGAVHVGAWLSFLLIRDLGVVSAMQMIVYGAAAGSLFASYFTYASDIIPIARRSEGFGLFGIWGMLPNGLAPKLGEWILTHGGFQSYFLVAAGFAAISLVLSLTLPEVREGRRSDGAAAIAPSEPFSARHLRLVLAVAFVFATAIESIFVFVAPFAYAAGRPSIGNFFLAYALSAVAVRIFAGRLPDRVGMHRVLLPALFVYAAGILLLPHFIDSSALIWFSLLCGAAHGFTFPILSALAVARSPETQRGRAVTWLTAMFDLGNCLANPTLGAIARGSGFTAMYTVSGAAMLAAAVVATRFRRGLASEKPAA